MLAGARGGRGGARGGRGGRGGGAFNPRTGTTTIGGVELNWDLTGLAIDKKPSEAFPPSSMDAKKPPQAKPGVKWPHSRNIPMLNSLQPHQPPQPPPPTEFEKLMLKHHFALEERIHNGPFYTVLNDGMKNGLKRKANEPAPTETSLFNPFTDNQTYTSKYLKKRNRLPDLSNFPFIKENFPRELWPAMGDDDDDDGKAADQPAKKRKTLQISKDIGTVTSRIDTYIEQQGQRLKDIEERGGEDEEEGDDEDEEEQEEDDKPDAVGEEDDWSAASSDSEESNDDYNAERYFDNGDDDDIDDGDGMENAYE